MLRFFHTSDWHLGQFFYNHSRHYEHACFLDWLLDQLQLQQPDALLIAGDVFDVVNPSTGALRQLNEFIAAAHQRVPHLQILIIAGNHDSGYRLEQTAPLLAKHNTQVVGSIEWLADKSLNLDKLLIPLYDRQQQIAGWCIALPYLRPAEITAGQLPTLAKSADKQTMVADTQGVTQALYAYLLQQVALRNTDNKPVILMTHAHMLGGSTSDSERPIVVGNAEALSTELFGQETDYVALGHLHRPQQIEAAHIRYSGSPIPLSFSEIGYQHQILHVSLHDDQPIDIQPLLIPRQVGLLRLKGDLQNVLQQARQLEAQGDELPVDQRTFVDVEYHSDSPPPPDFRQQLEQSIPSTHYRLVKISRVRAPSSNDSQTDASINSFELPTPQDLFQRVWQKQGFTIDDQVLQDFASLERQAIQLHEQTIDSDLAQRLLGITEEQD